MEKQVKFYAEGYDIYGMLHLPKGMSMRKKVPVVILCHGFTGNKIEPHRIFVKVARALEKSGVACLRFDFRGSGESEGNFCDFTIMDQVIDVFKAINFVSKQIGIDKNRIGLLGFSLGGIVASYVAGSSLSVKSLCLWAPPAELVTKAKKITREVGLKRAFRFKSIDYKGTLIGRAFLKQLTHIRPLAEIKHYHGSVLILHGERDELVPLADSKEYYDVLKKNKVKVWRYIIPGSNHTFNGLNWESFVIRKTQRFFSRNL